MVEIVSGCKSLIAFIVVYRKEKTIAYELTCINNIFALHSNKIGNINNSAALNVYVGVAFGWVNCHVIEIPGEFHFILEGCRIQCLRFQSLQYSGERKVIKINLPTGRYVIKELRGNGDGCREVDGSTIMDGKSFSIEVLLCSVFVSEDTIKVATVEIG